MQGGDRVYCSPESKQLIDAVANERSEPFSEGGGPCDERIGGHFIGAVPVGENPIFLRQRALDVPAEPGQVQQGAGANASPCDFVFVMHGTNDGIVRSREGVTEHSPLVATVGAWLASA